MMTLRQKSPWLLILLIGVLGVLPNTPDQPLTIDMCASTQGDRDDRDEETDASSALTVVAAASVVVHARRRLGFSSAAPKPLRRATRSNTYANTALSAGMLSPAGPTPASLRI